MSVGLDSCILIGFLRRREEARAYVQVVDGAAISLVTWMGVIAGVHTPAKEAAVWNFLAAFDVLPVDAPAAEDAVVLRRTRRRKLPLAIILATARRSGRALAARNTKDFRPDEPGITVPYTV